MTRFLPARPPRALRRPLAVASVIAGLVACCASELSHASQADDGVERTIGTLGAGDSGTYRIVFDGRIAALERLDEHDAVVRSIAVCPEGKKTLELARAPGEASWRVFERRLEPQGAPEPSELPVPRDANPVRVWCTDRDARDLVVAMHDGAGEAEVQDGSHAIVRVSSNGAATIWEGAASAFALAGRQLYAAGADALTIVDLVTGDETRAPGIASTRVLAVDSGGTRVAALADGESSSTPRVTLIAGEPLEVDRVVSPTSIRGSPQDAAWLDSRHLFVATSRHLGVIDTATGDDAVLAEIASGTVRSLAVVDGEAILDAAGLGSPGGDAVDGSGAGSSGNGGRPSGSAWLVGVGVFSLAVALVLLGRRWARSQRGSLSP